MPKKEEIDVFIIIFDVGGEMDNPDVKSFYNQAKDSLSMILQRKVLSRNTDEVGLILTGDDSKSAYIKFELQKPSWDMIRFVEEKLQPASPGSNRDWLDGIVEAISILRMTAAKRNIVLFSDFSYPISDSELKIILENMKQMEIELTAIGPDSFSVIFSEEPSAKKMKMNPVELKGLALVELMQKVLGGQCHICSLNQALRHLSYFTGGKPTTKPRPWNSLLEIGPIQISISAYLKVKPQQNYSYFEADILNDETTSLNSSSLGSQVFKTRHLSVATDPSAGEASKVNIEPTETVKGYRYGCTLVPFSDADEMEFKFMPGGKCLSIIGFTKSSNINRGEIICDSTYIVTSRKDDKCAEAAFSAVVKALDELSLVGIARKVYSHDRGLTVVMLSPLIEHTDNGIKECLLMHELPYKGDIRNLDYLNSQPLPFDKLSDEQLNAVDNLIDNMDLMMADRGPDGQPCEALDIYSLREYKNQFYQYCVVQKILRPDQPLPDKLPSRFAHNYEIPQSLQENLLKSVEAFKEVFPLVEISSREGDKTVGPSGDPIDDNVSGDNAIFEVDIPQPPSQSISDTDPEYLNEMKKVFNELGYPSGRALMKLLKMFIETYENAKDTLFDTLITIMKVLREFSIKNCPGHYNNWLREIKESCPTGGPIYEFFKNIAMVKYGLITKEESEMVDISHDAATNFFSDTIDQNLSDDLTFTVDEEREKLLDEIF